MGTAFEEVCEKDYKLLEDKFRELLEGTGVLIMEHPDMKDTLDTFILEVGRETKTILQKYGKQDHIQKLEVEDCHNQMKDMNRKIVKMNLQVKQVQNAVQGFLNVSKS